MRLNIDAGLVVFLVIAALILASCAFSTSPEDVSGYRTNDFWYDELERAKAHTGVYPEKVVTIKRWGRRDFTQGSGTDYFSVTQSGTIGSCEDGVMTIPVSRSEYTEWKATPPPGYPANKAWYNPKGCQLVPERDVCITGERYWYDHSRGWLQLLTVLRMCD